ncbi:MAG: hypothetical protein R2780_14710 [Crocinitomicaceae bacterium]|nr:hypothetical protein [Crocinitomicaceae bacterium]
MKRILALVIIALTTTFANAQSQPERYMFTGKLTNVSTVTTDCGSGSVAVAYEFTVSMLSDYSYTDQSIAILVKCPESYGTDFFKVGSTYKMELFDAVSGTYTIANPQVLNNYNLPHNYWAGDIKRLQ